MTAAGLLRCEECNGALAEYAVWIDCDCGGDRTYYCLFCLEEAEAEHEEMRERVAFLTCNFCMTPVPDPHLLWEHL